MKKSRYYYQERIIEMLEEAENDLNTKDFDTLLKRLQEVLDDYE